MGAVSLQVDGISVPVTSNQATLGPVTAGTHQFTITAVDADNSPETSSYHGTFAVINSERMGVLYQGNRVLTGSTLDVGAVRLNAPDAEYVLVLRNEGGEVLTLRRSDTSSQGTGSVIATGPMAATLAQEVPPISS